MVQTSRLKREVFFCAWKKGKRGMELKRSYYE